MNGSWGNFREYLDENMNVLFPDKIESNEDFINETITVLSILYAYIYDKTLNIPEPRKHSKKYKGLKLKFKNMSIY